MDKDNQEIIKYKMKAAWFSKLIDNLLFKTSGSCGYPLDLKVELL